MIILVLILSLLLVMCAATAIVLHFCRNSINFKANCFTAYSLGFQFGCAEIFFVELLPY